MIKSIWQEDDEHKLNPTTKETVAIVEEKLKVKLPESYISLLKEQNGGYIIFDSYPTDFPTSWADDHIHIDHIRGIGEEGGILESDYLIKEWGLPKKIVLISGDGHTWIALDYRQTSTNPPIIYIDNESGQIIEIAKNFKEFLSRLYNEEKMDVEEYYDGVYEYTTDDLDKYIKEDNAEKIISSLMVIVQSDVDIEWLSKRLLQLSTHANTHVRIEVANYVWNFLTYLLDDEVLNELLKTFQNDIDSDVNMYADLIMEKVNYSYEDLTRDVKVSGHAIFSFKDSIYHIHSHSNLWHVSDSEFDLQTFNTLDDLLEQATLEGIPLKEQWSEVKIV